MKRVLLILFAFGLLVGCNKQNSAPQSTVANATTTPTAAPSVTPNAIGVAPALATPGASNPATAPIVPPASKESGKQAKIEQKPLPPDLWQRMTRPLTLEEINKLPPETRDMILRAQGRLPASPAPKKK